MTEAQLKDAVIGLARMAGWLVHHDLPAQNRRGRWATHVQGDAGFPDLVLVHKSGRLIVAELKSKIGRLTVQQQAYLDAFSAAGIPTYIWRPDDWRAGTIGAILVQPRITISTK